MLISKDFILFAGLDAINLEQQLPNVPHIKSLKTKDSESGFNLFFEGSKPKDVNQQRFHSFCWPWWH